MAEMAGAGASGWFCGRGAVLGGARGDQTRNEAPPLPQEWPGPHDPGVQAHPDGDGSYLVGTTEPPLMGPNGICLLTYRNAQTHP